MLLSSWPIYVAALLPSNPCQGHACVSLDPCPATSQGHAQCFFLWLLFAGAGSSVSGGARLLSLPLGLGGHDAEAAAPSAVDVDDGGKAGLHVDVVVVRCTKALPSRIISVSVTVVTVTLLWGRSGEPLEST